MTLLRNRQGTLELVKGGSMKLAKLPAHGRLLELVPKMTLISVNMSDHGGKDEKLTLVLDTCNVFQDIAGSFIAIASYILFNTLIFSTIGFFRMRGIIFQPLERLSQVAQRYRAESTKDFTLASGGEMSELEEISHTITSMMQRIDADRRELREVVKSLSKANRTLQDYQSEIVRTEKLAATGRLSAGLAHEIGNPLTIVQGYLELLDQDGLKQTDRSQFISRGMDELKRIDSLIRRLLLFSSESVSSQTHVDINRMVTNLIEVTLVTARKSGVTITAELSEERLVSYLDEQSLRQVVLNLLLNAIDALQAREEGSRSIWVVTSLKVDPAREGREDIVISVADNGEGILEKDFQFIFEPFFTTKEPSEGTGLGLAVSYQLIKSFGGTIDVVSETGVGTVFDVILPSANDHKTDQEDCCEA